MSQHKCQSANAAHIKTCNSREAGNTQEPLAILNWFQIIYQRGRLQLPISHDSAAVQARYMLNTEECFCQVVSRPEIWYWTRDILESGSIDSCLERRCRNTKWQTTSLNKSCQPGITYWRQSCLKRSFESHNKTNRSWCKPNIPFFFELAALRCEVAWIVYTRHQQLHLDSTLIAAAAFITNETDRTFKGLNVLRLEKMIKGQRVSQPKYILNLLIRVVRDERELLANWAQISFCGHE